VTKEMPTNQDHKDSELYLVKLLTCQWTVAAVYAVGWKACQSQNIHSRHGKYPLNRIHKDTLYKMWVSTLYVIKNSSVLLYIESIFNLQNFISHFTI